MKTAILVVIITISFFTATAMAVCWVCPKCSFTIEEGRLIGSTSSYSVYQCSQGHIWKCYWQSGESRREYIEPVKLDKPTDSLFLKDKNITKGEKE